jgi:hypothetical protein
MAQQSARRGRENQFESECCKHARLMWIRSANSHSGQQRYRCINRPDRWQHPTTCPPTLLLAFAGASTDDSTRLKYDLTETHRLFCQRFGLSEEDFIGLGALR